MATETITSRKQLELLPADFERLLRVSDASQLEALLSKMGHIESGLHEPETDRYPDSPLCAPPGIEEEKFQRSASAQTASDASAAERRKRVKQAWCTEKPAKFNQQAAFESLMATSSEHLAAIKTLFQEEKEKNVPIVPCKPSMDDMLEYVEKARLVDDETAIFAPQTSALGSFLKDSASTERTSDKVTDAALNECRINLNSMVARLRQDFKGMWYWQKALLNKALSKDIDETAPQEHKVFKTFQLLLIDALKRYNEIAPKFGLTVINYKPVNTTGLEILALVILLAIVITLLWRHRKTIANVLYAVAVELVEILRILASVVGHVIHIVLKVVTTVLLMIGVIITAFVSCCCYLFTDEYWKLCKQQWGFVRDLWVVHYPAHPVGP